MNQQYLELIDKGYSLRTGSFERNYYDNDEPDLSENNITISDEEPDMPDIEDFLAEISSDESSNDSDSKVNTNTYNSDLSYIYYKGKSLNINIYHKQTELEKRQLAINSQGFIRENIIQSCRYPLCLRRPDGRLSKTWCTDNG